MRDAVHTTPAQDVQIQNYIDAAKNNAQQTYNTCANQCTGFVRNALKAGGVLLPPVPLLIFSRRLFSVADSHIFHYL